MCLIHGRDTSTEECGRTHGGRLMEQITGELPLQFYDSCAMDLIKLDYRSNRQGRS